MDAALLCAIHGDTVENTLFENNDSLNILCVFNQTQIFLYLIKKLLLTHTNNIISLVESFNLPAWWFKYYTLINLKMESVIIKKINKVKDK